MYLYLFVATSQPIIYWQCLEQKPRCLSESRVRACERERKRERIYTPKQAHSWIWSLICGAFLFRENSSLSHWVHCCLCSEMALELRRSLNSEGFDSAFVTCNECCAGFSFWGQGLSGLQNWGGHQFWKI